MVCKGHLWDVTGTASRGYSQVLQAQRKIRFFDSIAMKMWANKVKNS